MFILTLLITIITVAILAQEDLRLSHFQLPSSDLASSMEASSASMSAGFKFDVPKEKLMYYHMHVVAAFSIAFGTIQPFLTHKKEAALAHCSNFFHCGASYSLGMLDFLLKNDIPSDVADRVSKHMITCSEQAIMLVKALIMGDFDIVEIIISMGVPDSSDDADVKAFCNKVKGLGRSVKNFDPNRWNAILPEVVIRILIEKFKISHMRDMLVSALPNSLFVEAAPYDKIWGIGMAADHANINDFKLWEGYNMLGYGITTVFLHATHPAFSSMTEEELVAFFCNIFNTVDAAIATAV